MKGLLYGVGLGAGDPELLTVKARRLLVEADVILVPKGRRAGGSVARNILEAAFGEKLPIREQLFPMERDEESLAAHWRRAAEEVAAELDAKKNVAFVSLGDISLYSTFVYLERSLKKLGDYKVERVPGISSIQAASARLGMELAMGSESFAVMPLPKDFRKLEAALELHDTVVVMKIGAHLGLFREFLREHNLEADTGFVRRLGMDREVVAPSMAALPEDAEGYLSLAIIYGNKAAPAEGVSQ